MFNKLCLLFFSLCLFSCDHIHRAEIRNESGMDILLQISFNPDHMQEGHYSAFQNMFPGFDEIKALSMDTTTFTNVYRVKQGASFPLHDAIARDPDFTLFRQILIIKTDTLFLSNSEEISAAFDHSSERLWELVIK